jgi:biopolymer transport protein ExbD
MMRFDALSPRQARGENIVPMINVVFLLLIFFLMSAQIAPPDPVEISLPESASGEAQVQDDTLYVDAQGNLFFGADKGEAVWNLLASRDQSSPLLIRADATLPAAELAALLPKLAAAGVTDTLLVTGGR